MTPQQAEKVECFVRHLPPHEMPRLDALLNQFRGDYGRQYAPELIRALEEIADGRGRMAFLQDRRSDRRIPRRQRPARIRRFVEQMPDDQKPALARFLADAVEEHQQELAHANRRTGETVLGYLETAAKNGKIPNAYH